MSIYAIGDLHLSGIPPAKPMDIFGAHWAGHREKIILAWRKVVQPEDLVIVCGDISWGMSLPEALPDLEALAALPGKKVLLRGNHDYWWCSLKKMQEALGANFFFLQNNFFPWGDMAICGSRGWMLPDWLGFTPEDEPILRREVLRLTASLEAAKKAGFEKIIAALHYPPFLMEEEPSCIRDLLEAYGVQKCVFGHIHGSEGARMVFQGRYHGVVYGLVSCDSRDFCPVLIG